MDTETLKNLVLDLESDRTERKSSVSDRDEIKKAICAFANDLPNHQQPGYVFIGVDDRGNFTDVPLTDALLLNLANIRSEGNILPIPSMTVQKHTLENHEIAVVEVFPSESPPVRFNGVTWIRTGPRKDRATLEEERRLAEKRIAGNLPFDTKPFFTSHLNDLDTDYFLKTYLPNAIDPDILDENQRTAEDKLKTFRFISANGIPTAGGLLITGKAPQDWIPGAYVQFLRIDGTDLSDPILDQKEITGIVEQQLRELDETIKINISIKTEIPEKGPELKNPDYPVKAIQQLIRNAVMHRSYENTNAPVRFYWFSDRIEIQNPGGLYGIVNRENFGRVTDYRNPLLAEAMKVLGYVQKFGAGIQIARNELAKNMNPEPEFSFYPEHVLTVIRSNR